MEQDAWVTQELMEDPEAMLDQEEGYKFFMQNEPHAKTQRLIDESTGWRYQYWDIGLTRGAKPENKKQTKVFLDPIPHILANQNVPLRGWYKPKFEDPGKRPRPCYTEAILTQPYGGYCNVGCAFCYINHGHRGYRAQGIAVVDTTYPDKMRRQLKKMRTSAAGYLSSFTDPFLPLEAHYHNSQRTAEAFDDEGLPIFFLSRLKYPDWAYDLLRRNPYSYAQMSINTSDPDTWKRLSPRAIPLYDMFEQVRSLHEAGIYVSIQVNPILPGPVPNEDIVTLIHTLAQLGADHLIFKFVEISHSSRPALIKQVYNRWGPEKGKVFEDLFCESIGHQYTIAEQYRIDAHNRFSRECKDAGVTMALCYEYKYRRDDQGQIIDKIGVSMGADYLTADQCHGHRVPLFTRVDPGARFTPVEACPPSGCLTCADTTEQDLPGGTKGACGSYLFGQATALRPQDLLKPVEPDYPTHAVNEAGHLVRLEW